MCIGESTLNSGEYVIKDVRVNKSALLADSSENVRDCMHAVCQRLRSWKVGTWHVHPFDACQRCRAR